MAQQPRVFTIPASAQFLRTLVRAFMDDRLGLDFKPGADPLALAEATIYLPTRRACRLAQRTFLDELGGEAAILPRIVPIGDVDEDEIAFAEAAIGAIAGEALELKPALEGLGRRLPLTALILKWAKTIAPIVRGEAALIASTPATAFALAQDLARLMDDMTTRQVNWERLNKLVSDDLDEYWSVTLKFLKFVREQWPLFLDAQGKVDPVERRNELIAAEARQLERSKSPVIAAGSTGSIPATATLLTTIAKLPHGALVLPGLDTDLDEATWTLIAGGTDAGEPTHGHPQYAMAGLLQRVGISRASVTPLAAPARHGRERIVSEAMRPAASSELWQQRLTEPDFATQADAAMDGVAVIEAANAEEEALAIAVALRETIEDRSKTAALVTPDRALARRVLAALARWNIAADDSAGDALANTPAGVFARLVAEVALGGLAPVPLLALLKHPLCKFDAQAVATLERAILRGPRPKRSSAGLAHALAAFCEELAKYRAKRPSSLHHSDPRLKLGDARLDDAAALVKALATALAPLETVSPASQSFAELAQLHANVVDALGGMTPELARTFDEIKGADSLRIAPADYTELFHAAIAERKFYRPEPEARVCIYGRLEARLQSSDRVVLGGLIEGVWPAEARGDPWLSRPMRRELGLDLPERVIGLSAHDFAEALGTREVVLSRAARQAGAPTVASRFMQRLAAVAGESRWKAARSRGETYLRLARALDETTAPKPTPRPRPRPPLEMRPMSLSVTEIEDWLRDPYTIYAKHVLKLAPLDPIDNPPGATDRGTVIHGAIGDFTKAFAQALPDDALGELRRLGENYFAPLGEFEEARAFWWPRFLRIASWFTGIFEPERRARLTTLHAEIRGEIEIPVGDRVFKLRGVADRIERLDDGSYAILDYKTGRPPTDKQVRTGMSPQLTLEAGMLRRGGFKDIPAGVSVRELAYVVLRGGDPPGGGEPVDLKGRTPDAAADHALEKLGTLAAIFADEKQAYLSLVHPMWTTRYGDYDHLARVKEWSLTGGELEGDIE
jgi:ATP-dependent helicase/nuclease subunit B